MTSPPTDAATGITILLFFFLLLQEDDPHELTFSSVLASLKLIVNSVMEFISFKSKYEEVINMMCRKKSEVSN